MEALKALALAYPEAECLPEERRKPWLYERWVGLTQADRDAFRAALDAADAPPTDYDRLREQSGVSCLVKASWIGPERSWTSSRGRLRPVATRN